MPDQSTIDTVLRALFMDGDGGDPGTVYYADVAERLKIGLAAAEKLTSRWFKDNATWISSTLRKHAALELAAEKRRKASGEKEEVVEVGKRKPAIPLEEAENLGED